MLLAILIIIGILNFLYLRTIQTKELTEKHKRDEFAKVEERFKPKKHEEMARCSECGKIIPMSADRCPGCGLEFEN